MLLKRWWPEMLIGAFALFFILRHLGTFPSAWEDDSFYMIIAKNIATGQGYTLPVYDYLWEHPFFLAVGPTLLWPVALSIKIFGFSVLSARIPMALYLLLTCIMLYRYVYVLAGRSSAQWALALLVSLSAFINTGKPVLGEIPGFLYMLLGLLTLHKADRQSSWMWHVLAGMLFGLAIVTKLTYGIVCIGLGMALLLTCTRREWRKAKMLFLSSCTTILVLLLFNPVLNIIHGDFVNEVHQFALSGGTGNFLHVLREQPELLLRFPYLYFGALLILGAIGMWQMHASLTRSEYAILISVITLFMFYFLNNPGWYRHLLPAHLFLLPFVPSGAQYLCGKRAAAVLLTVFIVLQGIWQLQYRGSTFSDEGERAAVTLEERFRTVKMVVEPPEIYVRLTPNPLWFFISGEFHTRSYALFSSLPLTPAKHCLPLLRKANATDLKNYGSELIAVAGRYVLFPPPRSCTERGTP